MLKTICNNRHTVINTKYLFGGLSMASNTTFIFRHDVMQEVITEMVGITAEIESALTSARMALVTAKRQLAAAKANMNNIKCTCSTEDLKKHGCTCDVASRKADAAAQIQAYETAVNEAEVHVEALQQDMEATKEVIQTLRNIVDTVDNTERDVYHIITDALINLREFSYYYGDDVADVISEHATTATPGFAYVEMRNKDGSVEKLYPDLYTDFSHKDYGKLVGAIGLDATIAIMLQNKCLVEQVMSIAHDNGVNYSRTDVLRIAGELTKEPYTRTSENVTDIVKGFNDDATIVIDGKKVGGLLDVKDEYRYCQTTDHYFKTNNEGSCAAYAFATALSMKYGVKIEPNMIDTSDDGVISTWQTTDGKYTGGRVKKADAKATIAAVEAAIENGDPILLHSRTHWVTVLGKNADTGEYMVLDPYYDKIIPISQMQGYSGGYWEGYCTI